MLDAILSRGYLKEGEKDWNDIALRVSNFCGGKEMYHAMIEKKLIPASPFLLNAGTNDPQLFSCFVLPINDSIESIFDFYAKSAKVFKSSGGVGANWSSLRAKGSKLSGGGETSGVVSFMSIFNEVIETVKQGGVKKGAAMCCLNIEHPEAEDFIRMKLEKGKFTNFNISPVMTDDYMRRAIKGDEQAKKMIDLIVDCTWECSEPGMLFIDAANKDNTVPGLEEYDSTNPCVTGDTLILTSEGYIPIIECVGRNVSIWNGFNWSMVIPFKTSDNEELLKITLSNGSVIKCTPYHTFKTWTGYSRDGKQIDKQAYELTIGDKLQKFSYPLINGDGTLVYAYTQGFYSGDGYYSNTNNCHATYLYDEKMELLQHLDSVKRHSIESNRNRMFVAFSHDFKPKDFVPGIQFKVKSRVQWLSGLIDADGNVNCKEGCIQISSVNEEFLHETRRMINTLGISCKVSLMKDEDIKAMPDGKGGSANYYCQKCYRLTISPTNVKKLIDLGLKTNRVKLNPEPNRDAEQFIKVVSIEEMDFTEPVYCLSEPLNHTFIADGTMIGNCGEEWLFHYESCCLCGLSLVPLVRGNEVNWKDLEATTRVAIRFLDKAIDKNKYPLPEIEEATKKTRKLGLYVLGVADVLIDAGLGYDTKEGRAFIESIWKFINEIAWDESVKLGKKYGPFPAYDLRNPDLVPEGARNAAVTCAAPGGTTSFIAGANYGIEPFSSFVSERRNGAGEGLIVIPQFEQMLDRVCPEFKDDALKHCLQTGTIEDLPYLPPEIKKVYRSAFMIHWKAHIDMMAMFQKHCRAGSISKTVNLPASATKDDIREAYFYAWKSKCKGVTFYREGTRDAVYNLKKDEVKVTGPDYVVPNKAPAMRYNVTIGCGKMAIIVVGDPVSKEPIEVFTIPLTGGGCAGHCSGEGRTISNALQYGVPPSKFISSLSKVVCKACANKEKLDGKSCPDAMGKKLAEYIRDSRDLSFEIHKHIDSKKPNPNRCPECGTIMDHAEGCMTCKNCGYSKCN